MKIYELLDTEDKWIKGSFAKTKYGEHCWSQSGKAYCWCLGAAIIKCYGLYSNEGQLIQDELKRSSIIEWNDREETTYEDVINLCRKLDI